MQVFYGKMKKLSRYSIKRKIDSISEENSELITPSDNNTPRLDKKEVDIDSPEFR
jgi:hypothetical protein